MSTSYIDNSYHAQHRYITPVIAGSWFSPGMPSIYYNTKDPVRFGHGCKFMIQTGKIQLNFHGIPNLDKNIYTDNDEPREFIKVPLDPNPIRSNDISLKGTPKKNKKYLKQTSAYTGSKKTKKRHINKRNKCSYKN